DMIVDADENGIVTAQSGLTYNRSNGSLLDAVYVTDGMQGQLVELISAIYKPEGAEITVQEIKSAIINIKSTFEDVYNHTFPNKNQKAEKVIRNIIDDVESGDKIEVLFKVVTNLTLDKKSKRAIQKEIDKMVLSTLTKKVSYTASVIFGDDIKSELEQNIAPYYCVAEDKLEMDEEDNYLKYGKDSIICTIKASSLRDLWEEKKDRGLLAMNLRYYISQPSVDNKITQSIENDAADFWYMNNGIIIVCNDFKVEGTTLKLSEFSIVNGGQTTRNIGEVMQDDSKEFYLVCKVIRNIKELPNEQEDFVAKVAEASNTQKAIKPKDIIANRSQQRALKTQLEDNDIFCEIKRGEKPFPKERFKEQWQKTKNDELAQDILSFAMCQPGPARNSVSKVLDNQAKYDSIFVNHGEYPIKYLRDLLFLEKAFRNYNKVVKADVNADATKKGLVKNGMYYVLGIIGYLLKFTYTPTFIDRVRERLGDSDASFYKHCGEYAFCNGFIDPNISFQDFSSKAVKLFDHIVNTYMVPQFNRELMRTPDLAYSNWLKNNQGFMKIVRQINVKANSEGVTVASKIEPYFIATLQPEEYAKNDEVFAKSIAVATGVVKIETKKEEDPEADAKLYNELLSFAYAKGTEKHVNYTSILRDSQIDKIIKNKPTSKAALLKSTNNTVAFFYGDAILSIVEKYL
ncbi:MAG: AIPR family protein, partial [Bacilli bacterium]|nr:AIPR family protein [Bacilli bacterium]